MPERDSERDVAPASSVLTDAMYAAGFVAAAGGLFAAVAYARGAAGTGVAETASLEQETHANAPASDESLRPGSVKGAVDPATSSVEGDVHASDSDSDGSPVTAAVAAAVAAADVPSVDDETTVIPDVALSAGPNRRGTTANPTDSVATARPSYAAAAKSALNAGLTLAQVPGSGMAGVGVPATSVGDQSAAAGAPSPIAVDQSVAASGPSSVAGEPPPAAAPDWAVAGKGKPVVSGKSTAREGERTGGYYAAIEPDGAGGEHTGNVDGVGANSGATRRKKKRALTFVNHLGKNSTHMHTVAGANGWFPPPTFTFSSPTAIAIPLDESHAQIQGVMANYLATHSDAPIGGDAITFAANIVLITRLVNTILVEHDVHKCQLLIDTYAEQAHLPKPDGDSILAQLVSIASTQAPVASDFRVSIFDLVAPST